MSEIRIKKSRKRPISFVALALAALFLSACSSSSEDAAAPAEGCVAGELATVEAGVLTIATGEPAYYPWVIDDAPESGQGFEAAIAYAVAEKLGYST